jgi:hypothetical protein
LSSFGHEPFSAAKHNMVTFEGTVLQIPKSSPFRSHAHKRIDVHVMLDGAVEIFYKTEKIAAFDAKTTHALGYIEQTTNGKGSAMDLLPLNQPCTMICYPDILVAVNLTC